MLEQNIKVDQKTELNTFRHTFSHYHFDITPLLIEVSQQDVSQVMEDSASLWYNLQHPQKIGLAAATKKILSAVNKTLIKD